MYLFDESAHDLLAYQREVLWSQPWRLITANICHTNGYHLVFNLAGLILLQQLFHFTSRKLILLLLISSLCVTVGLYIFEPTVNWYVGLSGSLHALFAYGALQDIHKKVKFGQLLLCGLIVKLIYEHAFESIWIAQLIEANVMTSSHVIGAMAGVAYFVLEAAFRLKSNKSNLTK
ncbi:rhombosortase [Motilimonas pumila]|uniref:rhombosortase n=1 Tax=Motilimonas pumila TaxID=2303987 RepID=UPI0013141871|nr:rhombosortase [Motilimonas pumila]